MGAGVVLRRKWRAEMVGRRVASRRVAPYTRLMSIKKAVEIQGEFDDQHRLHADVRQSLGTGQLRVIVLVADEDEGGLCWPAGVPSEWSAERGSVVKGSEGLFGSELINSGALSPRPELNPVETAD